MTRKELCSQSHIAAQPPHRLPLVAAASPPSLIVPARSRARDLDLCSPTLLFSTLPVVHRLSSTSVAQARLGRQSPWAGPAHSFGARVLGRSLRHRCSARTHMPVGYLTRLAHAHSCNTDHPPLLVMLSQCAIGNPVCLNRREPELENLSATARPPTHVLARPGCMGQAIEAPGERQE
jgi:hypothetical protein